MFLIVLFKVDILRIDLIKQVQILIIFLEEKVPYFKGHYFTQSIELMN